MKRVFFMAAAALALTASPVAAHTGVGAAGGWALGFGHPIGGLDHVLAMFAVGVLAAQLGGRALWLVPSAFVGLMVVGGLFGVSGVGVPFVEQGIVGSVIILGAVVAWGRHMPNHIAMALVGVLAVFHGHAHGTEMPLNANGFEYALGFALATTLLHTLGIGIGVGLQKYLARAATMTARFGGALIALIGVGLAVA